MSNLGSGHLGPHLAERRDEGQTVILAAAFTDQLHELAGGSMECPMPMQHPAGLAARNDAVRRLPALGPRGPHGRLLAPCRLVPTPDLPARLQR